MNLAATLTLDNARFQKPMGESIRLTRDLRDSSGQMGAAVAAAAKGAGLGAVAAPAAAAVTSLALVRREMALVGRDIRSSALVPLRELRSQFAGLAIDIGGGGRGGRPMKNVTPFSAMRGEIVLFQRELQTQLALQNGIAHAAQTAQSRMIYAPIGRRITNGGIVNGGAEGAGAAVGAGSMAAQVARFAAPLAAVAASWKLISSSLGASSQMEDFTASFVTLLGSTGAAEQRMAQLAKFADTTPFELPEVAQASRVLETLTKGALSTGEGLTMVGNIAAVTQQPIGDLAMWVGRLYDGLQSGRAVGEAMMRLQELGVMSGEVRGRLESLQEAGQRGEAVWQVAAASFSRFAGEMDRKSQTLTGRWSTLKDSATAVLRELGGPAATLANVHLEKASTTAGQFAKNLRYAKDFWADLLGLKAPAEWQAPKKAEADKAPTISMGEALEGAFGGLDRLSAARAEMKTAFAEMRALNEQRVINDPFSQDSDRQKALESRARRLFSESKLRDEIAPGVSVNPGSIDAAAERLKDELDIAEAMSRQNGLAEQANAKIQALLPIYKAILDVQEQSNALKAKAIDAELKGFFDPLDKQSTTMGAEKRAPNAMSVGDRLSRIGLLVGAGGPANDHARRTADNTARMVTHLQRLPAAITDAIVRGNYNGERAALWGS